MKVSEEIARKDFERWFESKKLPETKRKNEYEVLEQELIEAIMDGSLIVNEDNTLTLKLAWPLTSPNAVESLNFVHRIQTGELQSKTAYAKDQSGKLIATVAALTGQVGGVIRALDPVDFGRAGAIAAYFF